MSKKPRVLVFAGAGASYAVSSEKYPTTVGFVDRLPADLKDHRLIAHLSRNFEQKFGDKTPDVEKILWCLDELYSYLSSAFEPSHPASWLIPNNSLPALVDHPNGSVSGYAAVAKTGRRVVGELRSRINSCIYEIYGNQPDKSETHENWGALLPELLELGYWVDLVTTNYDLVIESTIDDLELDIGYGQRRGAVTRLDLNVWKSIIRDESLPKSSGLVTKLHGSLNWERDGQAIAFSGVQFKSDHRHHAAIYPGFKGVPTDSPFDLFHDYFERALQSCEVVLFIGFAFRDEYINDLIRRAPSRQRYIVIDPSSLDKLPAAISGRVHHITRGFDRSACSEVVEILSAR